MSLFVCQQSYNRRKSAVSAISTPAQKHIEPVSNIVMVGPHFRIGHRIGRGNFGEVRIGNVSYCRPRLTCVLCGCTVIMSEDNKIVSNCCGSSVATEV